MKTSYYSIIALVGIAIIGATMMIYLISLQSTNTERRLPICMEGKLSNGKCFSPQSIDIGRSVEIDGLNTIYNWKQPIEFTILAHGFDGCEQIRIQVFDELKNQSESAIYDDSIRMNDCKNPQTPQLKEYTFPVKINPLGVPSGKYFLLITHAHTRTDIQTEERIFEISIADSDMMINNFTKTNSTYGKEITVLSVSPKNVTLPEHKPKPQVKQGILIQE